MMISSSSGITEGGLIHAIFSVEWLVGNENRPSLVFTRTDLDPGGQKDCLQLFSRRIKAIYN